MKSTKSYKKWKSKSIINLKLDHNSTCQWIFPAAFPLLVHLVPTLKDSETTAGRIRENKWVCRGKKKGASQNYCLGLPWWRSGWESACQCRGHGFEPWSGKIPHATEQLGLWATITEPARLEPVLRNKRGRDSERPVHHDKSGPRLPQLENALAQKRRPNTAINK